MAEKTTQQIVRAADGTEIVFDEWLKDDTAVTMSPDGSKFTATCPRHGQIKTAYVSMIVGWAINDHAAEWHGGLENVSDLLNLGPAIQI
jgi:hypothetical protein